MSQLSLHVLLDTLGRLVFDILVVSQKPRSRLLHAYKGLNPDRCRYDQLFEPQKLRPHEESLKKALESPCPLIVRFLNVLVFDPKDELSLGSYGVLPLLFSLQEDIWVGGGGSIGYVMLRPLIQFLDPLLLMLLLPHLEQRNLVVVKQSVNFG